MEKVPQTGDVAATLLTRRQILGLSAAATAGIALNSKVLDIFQPQFDTSPGPQIDQLFDYAVEEITYRFDAIRGMDWSEVPGVSVVPDGLRLVPLDPKIINKRSINNELQSNPPLNAIEWIRTNGDFKVEAGIESYGPVHVNLYGKPPIRQDDFRYEQGRLDFEIGYDKLTVRRWNGKQFGPVMVEFPLLHPGYSRHISVEHNGDRVVVFNGGELVGDFAAEDIFSNGDIWLGLNAFESPAYVYDLSFEEASAGQNSGLWRIKDTPNKAKLQPTLQDRVNATGRDLLIGTEMSVIPAFTDPLYRSALEQYGILTLGNGIKPQDRNPAEGVFEPKFGLSGLRLIHRLGKKAHLHTVYYDKANRKELESMPTDTRNDKLRIAQYLVDDTQWFAETYGSYGYSVDVTNEMIDGWALGVHMRQNVLMRGLGMDGVALLFKTASELMPGVKIGFNEYGFEIDPFRTKAAVAMIEYIRSHGGRVDFIGSQMHIYHNSSFINDFAMEYFLSEMRKISVEVHISEMDVTTSRGLVEQGKQFKKGMHYALHDENVKRYATWGPDDFYGSKAGINILTGNYDPGTGLLLDKDFRETLAMRMILDEIATYASLK